MSQTNKRQQHVNGLDGLRAFAALLVFGFHTEQYLFKTSLFSAGFVGVDLFIVLTGFLIGRQAASCHGLFDFLIRRAKRLLPLYFFVLVVTSIVALFFLNPLETREYFRSVSEANFFRINLWFGSNDSYFDLLTFSPLLHFWSLSLEIQYYLLFGCLYFLGLIKPPKTFLLLSLSLISISIMITGISTDNMQYFSLYTRLWEFLLGAAFGLGVLRAPERFPNTIGVLFLGVFCFVFWVLDGTALYPNWVSIPLVVSTAFLISSFELTKERPHAIRTVLSYKPLAKVGAWSYGVYLWHLPVIFFFDRSGVFSNALALVTSIGIVTLVASALTHIWIENPLRLSWKNQRSLAICFFLFVTLSFALSLASIKTNGNIFRFNDVITRLFDSTKDSQYDNARYVEHEFNNRLLGKVFVPGDQKKLLIYGDSFAQDFYNALIEGEYINNVEVVGVKLSSECMMHSDFDLKEIIGTETFNRESCDNALRFGSSAMDEYLLHRPAVIISSDWTANTASRLPKLLSSLRLKKIKDVLIVGPKRLPIITSLNGTNDEILQKILNPMQVQQYNQIAPALNVMHALDLKNFLDVHSLFCPEKTICRATTSNGKLISYDGRHLSRDGAQHLANLLRLDPIFLSFINHLQGEY